MKSIQQSILFIAAITLLVGCASGPRYEEVRKSGRLVPQPNKALVLIFRPPAFQGGAARVKVFANNTLISNRLQAGAFCTYDADPGPLRISSGTGSGDLGRDMIVGTAIGGGIGAIAAYTGQIKDMLTLNIQPNETRFVEMRLGFWREYYKEVTSENGQRRIVNCRWINPK